MNATARPRMTASFLNKVDQFERDPAMREFLERISPLTNAHKIKKPLFVIQGKNDPRVPVTEAEQIVERVRLNGTPVWYLRGENEGHGCSVSGLVGRSQRSGRRSSPGASRTSLSPGWGRIRNSAPTPA